MALAQGTEVILKNGKRGKIEAVFGHADMREYRVRVGKETLHFVETDLLSEIVTPGVYRFDMSVNSCLVR